MKNVDEKVHIFGLLIKLCYVLFQMFTSKWDEIFAYLIQVD